MKHLLTLVFPATVAALLGVAGIARADDVIPAGEDDAGALEHEDPTAYILHHVSDSREFEFENPFSAHGGLKVVFPLWRIPFKPGACPASADEPAVLGEGCLDISLTKNVFMMMLSSFLLIAVMVLGSHRDPKQLAPRGGLANFLEMMILFVRNEIAVKNIGQKEASRYTPYLLSIFFFILASNLLGLFPWMSTATGNLAVTAGLAICTFLITQLAAIRSAGIGGYFKHLTGGVHPGLWIIMIPVEVMGLFTKPFALTIRLFANMLAGHLVLFFLLALIFFLNSPLVGLVAVPVGVGIYLLELFVALVQAYVFTMLSAVFIGMGVASGHHDHEAHDAGHAAAH